MESLPPPALDAVWVTMFAIRTPRAGGKTPNQKCDEKLLHQVAPRATLPTNQLSVISLTTQHPEQAHGQFACDRYFRDGARTPGLESSIMPAQMGVYARGGL